MYAAGPVLIKTKIPRFYPKQGASTHNDLLGMVKAIWDQLCAELNPLSHFKRFQMGIFGFLQKETGAESVAMTTTQ